MITQVVSKMWLQTAINYQHVHGGSFSEALQALYSAGGVRRFYRGVGFALAGGPISRFGDTALRDLLAHTGLPVSFFWRLLLMPIGTCTATLQVWGSLGPLRQRYRADGLKALPVMIL